MTTEQVGLIKTSLESAGSSVLENFISILPSVATIIAIIFVIGFVTYWLKKLRKVR